RARAPPLGGARIVRRAAARRLRRACGRLRRWRHVVIPGVIAKHYASALLELGTEAGQLDALVQEIDRAAQAYEASSELRGAFDNPLVPAAAKKAILGDVSERLGLGATA